MIPKAAEHSSPPHQCQLRCRVPHGQKGRPASAGGLLELQQSQLNPNTYQNSARLLQAAALCSQKPDPFQEIKIDFK